MCIRDRLDVVEACEDVALLSEDDADSDHDHDHEADAESDSAHDHDHGDENAHAWMSVPRYRTMVQTCLLYTSFNVKNTGNSGFVVL